MIDITGMVIAELRDDDAVAAIVGPRVRGVEPAAGDRPPMVIVTRMSGSRDPGNGDSRRAGLQEVMLGVKCYGTTPQQASQLYGACSDALHAKGPRVDASARAIFWSFDDLGSSPGKDPGTNWPWVDFTARIVAAAEAVA